MTIERVAPKLAGDERYMLDAWLDYHRDTLALKCDGLSADQLRMRSVPTTTLTLLGLVRHMTEVERFWFRHIFDGEDTAPVYYTDDDPDGDFNDVTSHEPDEVFERWRAEIDNARTVTRERSLDELGARTDVRNEPFSLRWIVTHMIEEYARHNGHADLIREAIDGATGD
ncbi:MAG TPA: DinB family protein [Actinomycetota bacterium]|nr:DinB family protein [Actinomycetota bacterium]